MKTLKRLILIILVFVILLSAIFVIYNLSTQNEAQTIQQTLEVRHGTD